MEDYLTSRDNLKQVFMLVDFRHKLTKDDIMMYNYLKHYQIPVTIVATKIDKLPVSQHQKQRGLILEELNLPVGDEFIMFSNVTKEGRTEIYDRITRII